MAEMVLPPSVYRNESIYRNYHGRPAPVRSCGLMLKPSLQGAYRTRTLSADFVAVYVLRGSGTFFDWHHLHHQVGAGDVILMPQGKRHGVQQDADGQWAEAYITLDGRFGNLLHRLNVIDLSQPLLHIGLDVSLVQRFEHILNDLTHLPDYALPTILSQAHELLSVLSQVHRRALIPSEQQHTLETACMLLSLDLEKHLDIADVAAQLNMSYERFRKLFRQRIGVSPGDYRIRRRVDRARALIGQHRLSNKQTAYELGYPDPFTFSRQFQRFTGQWPDAYRQSLGM